MRLYLSSYRFGAHLDRLLEMIGPNARAAVISNALDFIPIESRQAYARTVYSPIEALADAGVAAAELDLRDYFGRAEALEAALAQIDLVWCTGGNAFLLRRAMRQSGFDAAIGRLLSRDALVYGGDSAGAAVAGPNLRGLELMDDPQALALGYDPETPWEGLGLVDFAIVPHFRSDHAESEAAERAVADLDARGVVFEALSDGDVVIRRGETIQVLPA